MSTLIENSKELTASSALVTFKPHENPLEGDDKCVLEPQFLADTTRDALRTYILKAS